MLPASYDTRPLDSHVAQSEPQHAAAAPLAGQVPFGQDPPARDEYPLDSQYPASGPPEDAPEDAPEDEQAAARSTSSASVESLKAAPSRPS